MAKDPAFLFYPNDWIGGTMGMTFEEKGAYMELLMLQFNRGHMTTHMIGQTVGQLWGQIKDKFSQDSEGLWYNPRLEEEQEKRKKYTNSRRNNILGKNQHSKSKGRMGGHMTKHMENVNVNVNTIPSIEVFIAYAMERKPNVNKEAVELKYYAWKDNGWKTTGAKGRQIKNWKSTLLNTLPHLKENSKDDLFSQYK
jgi:uncharacterized protein YdaU (DUF1376 family)